MKVVVYFEEDGFTVEADVTVEGDRWCVCAGDFALMPAGFGRTIPEAIESYRSSVKGQSTPTPVEVVE